MSIDTNSQKQQHADKTLIQYIQDVILQIKKNHEQCNLRSIFYNLKNQHADNAHETIGVGCARWHFVA